MSRHQGLPHEPPSDFDDEQLRALSPARRRSLAARLTELDAPPADNPDLAATRRRRFLLATTAATLILVPWIAFLAVTLPHRYVSSHWTLTWVGFDVALVVGLGSTAWLAWRGRDRVVLAALVTATLLVCDAWFDVLTADPADTLESVLSAVLLEIPLAALLLTSVHLVLRRIHHRQNAELPHQQS